MSLDLLEYSLVPEKKILVKRQNLANLHFQNEQEMLRNRLKIIMGINIIPLIINFFNIVYYKWYYFQEGDNKNQKVWISLLYAYNQTNNEKISMDKFKNNCRDQIESDYQISECDFIYNFQIAGILIFLFEMTGIILQIISIIQMVLLVTQKYSYLQLRVCLKPKVIKTVILILYLVSPFFWFISSLIVKYKLKGQYSLCFFLSFGSAFIYILLVVYSYYLEKKIKEKREIQRYLQESFNENNLSEDSLLKS